MKIHNACPFGQIAAREDIPFRPSSNRFAHASPTGRPFLRYQKRDPGRPAGLIGKLTKFGLRR
jgi:hypothetical protein